MDKKAADKKKGPGRGRPKGTTKVPVDEKFLKQVEQLRGLGLPISDIAPVMGVGERTFHDMMERAPEISAALERGRAKARAMVSKAAFDMASSGKNFPATAFWLRTQAGWKEQVDINVNTKNTVVFEAQITGGVLRSDVKELEEEQKNDPQRSEIDNVIDAVMEEACPSSESESQ